jgi:hypothetical protein
LQSKNDSSTSDHHITTIELKKKITKGHYKCFQKVEDLQIDPKYLTSPELVFSGTDNGIVTMTETTKFDLDRFRFHLKLYSRFSFLDNNENNNNIGDTFNSGCK